MLADLVRDLRLAARQLRRAPGFAAVAVLTMALGIGANTAIFSVVHGALLRPLPYPDPERLLFVDAVLQAPDGEVDFQLSYPELADLAAGARSLSAVAAWSPSGGLAIADDGGAARLETNFVGDGYFELLGARPLAGRLFSADEHALDGAAAVVVLSEATWRQRFGADPDLVGREIRLQGRPFTVVGVLPSSFYDVALRELEQVDAWVPIESAPSLFGTLDLRSRAHRQIWGVARLAPGVEPGAAAAEMAAIGERLAAEHPQSNANFAPRAVPLGQTYFPEARAPFALLLGGSLFVLLIGCANVANLLLVRASGRAREIALRLTLGASLGRVARQLAAESLVVAGAGGVAGVLAAAWATPALVALSGLRLPGFARVELDAKVLAATAALTAAAALLSGFLPALAATRRGRRDTGGGSSRVTASGGAARWIAGVEIAAAFVLVAGALLVAGSFLALTRTDLGFRHERLLTVRLELPHDRYSDRAAQARFGVAARQRLLAVPGVESAVIWGPSMFTRSNWVAMLARPDQIRDDERTMLWRHSTNPGALGDLGIRLLAGRDFVAGDDLEAPRVAIVSESAAARFWPQGEAVGQRLIHGQGANRVELAVVGVAADARHRGRFRFGQGAAAFGPQLDLYLPFAQRPNALVTLGVRTAGDPAAATAAVRAALAEIDPELPLFDVAPLAHRMRDEAAAVGFAALLMNAYGALALFLAVVGVYGVLAAAVEARRRELGVRAALGAAPATLRGAVVRDGLRVAAAAVAVGLGTVAVLARAVEALLFGVAPLDPRVLGGTAVVMLAAAALASLLPAARAARTEPARVLRAD